MEEEPWRIEHVNRHTEHQIMI